MATFPFGKYAGQQVMVVWESDSPYCQWFLQSVTGAEAVEAAKDEIRQFILQENRLQSAERALRDGALCANDMIRLSEGGVMTPKQGERYMVLLGAALAAGIVEEE